jgi:hypothetical protein
MSKRKDISPQDNPGNLKKPTIRMGERIQEAQRTMSEMSLTSQLSSKSRSDTSYSFGGTNRGKMRTMIEVDILTRDGEPFTRSMTEKEAYKQIYKKSLMQTKENLAGIQRSWRGHPFFCFRTKVPVNIDTLPSKFSYTVLEINEDGEEEEVKIQCMVRGVGGGQEEGMDGPRVRWVKIEGTSLNIKEDEIKTWLANYGELLSEIEEEELCFSDDEDSDGSQVQVGTGKFSVKMKISSEIPQYLPMYGHKAKIHYRGIHKVCTNCYQKGHYRKECSNQKVEWLTYVAGFINDNEHIPDEMFGRWYKLCLSKSQESKDTNQKQLNTIPPETAPEKQIMTKPEETKHAAGRFASKRLTVKNKKGVNSKD